GTAAGGAPAGHPRRGRSRAVPTRAGGSCPRPARRLVVRGRGDEFRVFLPRRVDFVVAGSTCQWRDAPDQEMGDETMAVLSVGEARARYAAAGAERVALR